MRKGQKKKKDVMELNDHAMVKFWDGEQSPLFNGETHEFIDSIFTRDPRLKSVRVQMRSMFDPVTTDYYTSYELSFLENEEAGKLEDSPRVIPEHMPLLDGQEKQEIPNDRQIPELIMGQQTG